MSVFDLIHASVKTALEKQQWTITHDPLVLRVDNNPFYIDLGAEKVLAAELEGEKIAVEVKSFVGKASSTNFYMALGQYINYRLALAELEPDRVLYLAAPQSVWSAFLRKPFNQRVLKDTNIRVIVVNIQNQTIVEWKK